MTTAFPVKLAPVDHPVADLIVQRWSPISFSDAPIEPEKILSLFEAARWAPSSYNEQPWRYVYVTKDDQKSFNTMASLLVDGNAWAKNAYMLLVICASPLFAHNSNPNRHHQYDTGAATEHLFLQATSMGLVGHEMAGFDYDKAHEVLGIPQDIVVLTLMAIGYPAEPSAENVAREQAPRKRKALSEFVHVGMWGTALTQK